MPERVGTTKWFEADRVYWRDRDIVWTVQPGPCSAGAGFVHVTAPGLSAIVWQDELVLADPGGDRA